MQAYADEQGRLSGQTGTATTIMDQFAAAMNQAQGPVLQLGGVMIQNGEATDQLAQAQKDAAVTAGDFGNSAQAAYDRILSLATISGLSADEIQRMGSEAGLSAAEIESIKAAADSATEGASPLAEALASGSSAASEMDAAIQLLQIALDTLAGNTIEAEQAQRAHNAMIREAAAAGREKADATAAAIAADEKVNELTAQGITTGTEYTAALRAQVEAHDALADAGDKASDTLDQLATSAKGMTERSFEGAGGMNNYDAAVAAATATMEGQRKQFIDSAIAAGVGETAANELADAQGLIPANVRTSYDAIRADQARQAAQDVGGAVNNVPNSKTITFSSNAYTLISDLSTLEGQIRRIDGSTVTVTRRVVGDQMLVANRGGQIQGLIKSLNARLPGMSGGGQVPGTPPSNPREDNVLASALGLPIMLRSREWVQPEESVDYYGPNFMRAIQHRTFPKPQGYAMGGQPGQFSVGAPSVNVGAPMVQVFIGDDEITDRVNVVVDGRFQRFNSALQRKRAQSWQ